MRINSAPPPGKPSSLPSLITINLALLALAGVFSNGSPDAVLNIIWILVLLDAIAGLIVLFVGQHQWVIAFFVAVLIGIAVLIIIVMVKFRHIRAHG